MGALTRLNLLLLALVLGATLGAVCVRAGFGDLFKKKEDERTTPAPRTPDATAAADKASAPAPGGSPRARPNLDSVRAARDEQDRLAAELAPKYPKRPTYKPPSSGGGGAKLVQGRGRHASAEQRPHDQQDDDDDDDEAGAGQEKEGDGGANGASAGRRRARGQRPQKQADGDELDGYDEAMAAYRRQQNAGRAPADGTAEDADEAPGGLMARIKNKKVREQLAARFVSTHKAKGPADSAAGESAGQDELLRPKISVRARARRPLRAGRPEAEGAGGVQSALGAKKIASAVWAKRLGKALKGAKRGLRAGASAIAELPAYVATVADSVNAFLQLDGKGKLLALIEQVRGDIHFVREQFSQFTLNWSPIMEKGLDYLGDRDLDKIKWSDRDELDLRKDALHSLTIGFEFMRLMVAWRENLLMAHEAYKLWLESVKGEYEQKHFEVDDDMIMQLGTIQNYLLLTSWEQIDEEAHETRAKLDHLMEIEDDQPKNYESEYARNVIVLQEMYFPTVEEFDKERAQVQESISESGVVVDNLEQVDEFFDNFRRQVRSESRAAGQVDCLVPRELRNFLDKLKPQLDYTPLVYTKGYIRELKEAREARQREAQQELGQREAQQELGQHEAQQERKRPSPKQSGRRR